MKNTRIIALMSIAAISLLLWSAGLLAALQHYLYGIGEEPARREAVEQETKPRTPTVDDGRLRIVGLGDSLTRGAGDLDGRGYMGDLVDKLEATASEEIVLTNYAVNGLTSDGLMTSLERPEVQEEIAAADVITLSIGGNDLFQGGDTLSDLSPENINRIQVPYLSNLKQIMDRIRSWNSDAVIYMIGLYNPFIDMTDIAERTTQIVMNWNYEVADALTSYPNSILVPTFDLFQRNVQDYLADDLFHPNSDGYQRIGERVAALAAQKEAEA